ncbi:MAG: phosphoribosylamine--glycine ligase [Candidatus Aminicenantes bacterium]|nr:phosphoribosylamine--glycine ligase [Candidatus Aminicenantes bacterium]
MNVLVVGSGGREHALAWKISKSPRLSKLYCAPGNGGTRLVAENIAISDADVRALADFAARERIDLTVVGPEVPLSLGLVDEFEKRGLRVFGPTRTAAELEGSKVYAKQFMDRHAIPTGRFKVAESADEALAVLRSAEFCLPVVVKADGLAAGKGVIICKTTGEAELAICAIMVEKQFGEAGRRVLIEEFLRGKEVSFIVVSDGARALPFVTTMDHKAVFDGDEGPNTGGMGTISPSPFLSDALFDEVMRTIIGPTIVRMAEDGRPYKGALYAGLMLTAEGPKVLEYNCRFGDPETQPQMLRLSSDLVDLLLAAVEGDIGTQKVHWSEDAAACVILASGGYPGAYEKGKIIEGLEEAARLPGVEIFHAGTKYENGRYLTSGGRVLGVCGTGPTLAAARAKIYGAVGLIRFDGLHYRRDIGTARMDA